MESDVVRLIDSLILWEGKRDYDQYRICSKDPLNHKIKYTYQRVK